MMIWMVKALFISFFALFIAIDAVGILPVFICLTEGVRHKEYKKILQNSVYAASFIAVGFMFLGGLVFWIMGISMADFQIAGGVLLFIFSVHFLMTGGQKKRIVSKEVAIFPLATPLLVGPAVLTMLLILKNAWGTIITVIAFIANMALVFLIFERSKAITKLLGINGIKAISKIVDILLSAFAVMLIRKGIKELFF